jgi:hypothetical protein
MRTFWILMNRFGLFLLLLGLGAPFLLTALGVLIEGRRGKQGKVRHFGTLSCGGCALGTVLGLWLLFLTMCGTPPGKGVRAESWYERTAPIVAGLDSYHADRGAYPDSLQELVPKYLAASALSVIKFSSSDGLEYRTDSTGFRLEFHYAGPRLNTCTYNLRSKRWDCAGPH